MNETIFFFFYNLAHRSNLFDHIVVFFAVYFPYLVWVVAFLFLVMHHRILSSPDPLKEFSIKWKEIVFVFLTGTTAWIVARLLKILIHIGRPFDAFSEVSSLFPETGFTFPSGHATFFMALAVSIFFLHKKTGYMFIFFALLIGFARIISGVHFPIDILGGFFLGFLIAYLFNRYFKK